MFGFTTIVSSALALLLVSQSAVAAPHPVSLEERSLNIHFPVFTRDTNTSLGLPGNLSTSCQSSCNALKAAFGNTSASTQAACNNNTVQLYQTCFDCALGTPKTNLTVAGLQATLNNFLSGCAASGVKLNNVTLAAKKSGGRGDRLVVGGVSKVVPAVAALVALSFALL